MAAPDRDRRQLLAQRFDVFPSAGFVAAFTALGLPTTAADGAWHDLPLQCSKFARNLELKITCAGWRFDPVAGVPSVASLLLRYGQDPKIALMITGVSQNSSGQSGGLEGASWTLKLTPEQATNLQGMVPAGVGFMQFVFELTGEGG